MKNLKNLKRNRRKLWIKRQRERCALAFTPVHRQIEMLMQNIGKAWALICAGFSLEFQDLNKADRGQIEGCENERESELGLLSLVCPES